MLANGELGESSEEEVPMLKRDLRRRQDKWYSNCWNKWWLTIALVKAYREEAEADPVAKAELHMRIVSEQRITALKAKLSYLRQLASESGEVNAPILMTNVVTNQEFALNRGENKTQRMTDPWVKNRVKKILEKVEIGKDVTEEQRQKISDLVKEYVDVFALTMSEVRVVD